MLSAEQIEIRRSMITATDVRAIARIDSAHTEHDVYREKCGEYVPQKPTFAMRLGNAQEPVVLEELIERENVSLHFPGTIRSAAIPWAGATPDAVILGSDGWPQITVEAKFVGNFRARDWGQDVDAIPDAVRVQATWQMLCLGESCRTAYVPMANGTEFSLYVIDYDPELAGVLVAGAEKFWRDHVVAKKPPALDGSPAATEMLHAIYPRPTRAEMVQASPEIEALAQEAFRCKAVLGRAEQDWEMCKQQIIAACNEYQGIKGNGWRLLFSERKEVRVEPKPYIRKAHRYFDLRQVKSAKAA